MPKHKVPDQGCFDQKDRRHAEIKLWLPDLMPKDQHSKKRPYRTKDRGHDQKSLRDPPLVFDGFKLIDTVNDQNDRI